MLFDTALNTALYQPVVSDSEFTPSVYLLMITNIGVYGYLIVKLVYYVSMIRI